jgi:hypothetical protein
VIFTFLEMFIFLNIFPFKLEQPRNVAFDLLLILILIHQKIFFYDLWPTNKVSKTSNTQQPTATLLPTPTPASISNGTAVALPTTWKSTSSKQPPPYLITIIISWKVNL